MSLKQIPFASNLESPNQPNFDWLGHHHEFKIKGNFRRYLQNTRNRQIDQESGRNSTI